MANPPSDLPPPAPQQQAGSPTRIAGQEHAPASEVPAAPPGYSFVPARGQTNTMAVISLVTGLAAFFGHIVLPGLGGGTLALVAIVTGYMARQQIKLSGEKGMGMATLGMILGIVHFAILILIFVVLIMLIFVFGLALFGFHK